MTEMGIDTRYFLVKVVRSSGPQDWYANEIGQIFRVRESKFKEYILENCCRWVSPNDAIRVPDPLPGQRILMPDEFGGILPDKYMWWDDDDNKWRGGYCPGTSTKKCSYPFSIPIEEERDEAHPKEKRVITQEEATKRTSVLFRYLATHPKKSKLKVLKKFWPDEMPKEQDCYLCGAFGCCTYGITSPDKCPIDVEGNECCSGIFQTWVNNGLRIGRESAATKIADLCDEWVGEHAPTEPEVVTVRITESKPGFWYNDGEVYKVTHGPVYFWNPVCFSGLTISQKYTEIIPPYDHSKYDLYPRGPKLPEVYECWYGGEWNGGNQPGQPQSSIYIYITPIPDRPECTHCNGRGGYPDNPLDCAYCGGTGKTPLPQREQLPKPPIGLKPKPIHDEQRCEEISKAINRYLDSNNHVPIEWIQEYNELIQKSE